MPFNLVKPVKGQNWLFISRDYKASDRTCQISYRKSSLIDKDIEGLGKIYGQCQRTNCFGGSYACSGTSPKRFVISQVPNMRKNSQVYIGHVVHELLHALGLGHTQKRQDASENIDIKWENIKPSFRNAFNSSLVCTDANDKRCSQYNTYGTDYDCMSIMHYRDRHFRTQEAIASGGKTMVAKKEGCDLSSRNNHLTDSDVAILNQMYCALRSPEMTTPLP